MLYRRIFRKKTSHVRGRRRRLRPVVGVGRFDRRLAAGGRARTTRPQVAPRVPRPLRVRALTGAARREASLSPAEWWKTVEQRIAASTAAAAAAARAPGGETAPAWREESQAPAPPAVPAPYVDVGTLDRRVSQLLRQRWMLGVPLGGARGWH